MKWLRKGHWIRAVWYEAHLACLAGAQENAETQRVMVEGVVRHVRGDHPTEPTSVRVFIETDGGEWCERCGVRETAVNPVHIVKWRVVPREVGHD